MVESSRSRVMRGGMDSRVMEGMRKVKQIQRSINQFVQFKVMKHFKLCVYLLINSLLACVCVCVYV